MISQGITNAVTLRYDILRCFFDLISNNSPITREYKKLEYKKLHKELHDQFISGDEKSSFAQKWKHEFSQPIFHKAIDIIFQNKAESAFSEFPIDMSNNRNLMVVEEVLKSIVNEHRAIEYPIAYHLVILTFFKACMNEDFLKKSTNGNPQKVIRFANIKYDLRKKHNKALEEFDKMYKDLHNNFFQEVGEGAKIRSLSELQEGYKKHSIMDKYKIEKVLLALECIVLPDTPLESVYCFDERMKSPMDDIKNELINELKSFYPNEDVSDFISFYDSYFQVELELINPKVNNLVNY